MYPLKNSMVVCVLHLMLLVLVKFVIWIFYDSFKKWRKKKKMFVFFFSVVQICLFMSIDVLFDMLYYFELIDNNQGKEKEITILNRDIFIKR